MNINELKVYRVLYDKIYRLQKQGNLITCHCFNNIPPSASFVLEIISEIAENEGEPGYFKYIFFFSTDKKM